MPAASPQHPLHSLRTQLLYAMLPHVAFDGWSDAALQQAAKETNQPNGAAAAAFPRGGIDALLCFLDEANDATERAIAAMPLERMKVREKITEALMARFEWSLPHREAVRRGLSLLAMPQHAPAALQALHAAADRIWWAIGDTSTDMNYYSKRATLGAVYSATLLIWLDDSSADLSTTRAFLERRIANVMSFEKAKYRAKETLAKLTQWLPRSA